MQSQTLSYNMSNSAIVSFQSVEAGTYDMRSRGRGERSGSLEECLTQDRGGASSSLTRVTALCPWHISPCLVLVQPGKTWPDITENCWLGRKESRRKGGVHCVVSLSKTLYLLLNTCSIQETSWHVWKIVAWHVKHDFNQTNCTVIPLSHGVSPVM